MEIKVISMINHTIERKEKPKTSLGQDQLLAKETNQFSSSILNPRRNRVSLNFVQGYDCYSSSKIAILKKLFSSTFRVYNNIK